MGWIRSKRILGVDLGSHSVKLVEVVHGRHGPMISYAACRPIPDADIPERSKDEVEQSIQETLHALVRSAKARGKRVVTAVPSSYDEFVAARSIFVRDLSGETPKEALRTSIRTEFEAQDYIPYNDEAEIDFHVEGEATVNRRRGIQVFVVAVHRELIRRRVQLLRSCGLVPIAIDVDFLALLRLVSNNTGLSDSEEAIILDLGDRQTSVGFVQDGRLHLYPHIPVGGHQLTLALASHLGSDDWPGTEAQKHQTKLNVTDPDGAPIARLLEAQIEQHLLEPLHRRLEAHQSEHPHFRPSRVILSGGAAQLQDLDTFISSRLGTEAEIINYSNVIPLQDSGRIAALKTNGPLFSVAVGLGLKRVS